MKTTNQNILCILILQVVWKIVTGNPEGEQYHSNSTLAGIQLKNFKDVYRLYNGDYAEINSMCMLMASNAYYQLEDNAYALNFSPRCFVTAANVMADSSTTPPGLNSRLFYTALCPGERCDVNYHFKSVFFNTLPYYSSTTKYNNIAVVKTEAPVFYDTKCRKPPLEQAWISCDPDGPPDGFTDCFMASYGNVKVDQLSAPEDIEVNKRQEKILSATKCQTQSQETTAINYESTNQICATGLDGGAGLCSKDYNPFLFCKYWGNDSNTGWGSNNNGWGSNNNGWKSRNGWKSKDKPSSNGGWGSNTPKAQNLLAVGHLVNAYPSTASTACTNPQGVDIFVKYGSPSYRQLFSNCGYYCSSNLLDGYRCKVNPPKNLGPVYCYAEKIPHNSGWNSQSTKSNGWTS